MIYIFRSQQRVWGSSLQSKCAAWKSGKWLKELKAFLSININDSFLLSKVEMRCHPPRGKPPPSISWMKDGQELDIVNDPNYLTAADGHLIIIQVVFSIKPFFFFTIDWILQVRPQDISNYSCVAENMVNRRVSSPARLEIVGELSSMLLLIWGNRLSVSGSFTSVFELQSLSKC